MKKKIMIIDVWGPKFVKINGKKEISFFEIKKTQNYMVQVRIVF